MCRCLVIRCVSYTAHKPLGRGAAAFDGILYKFPFLFATGQQYFAPHLPTIHLDTIQRILFHRTRECAYLVKYRTHTEQVLQLQSALHATPPPQASTAKGFSVTVDGRPESTSVGRPVLDNATTATSGCLGTKTSPRMAAEEELMLSDNYGLESSHLNELMKKVRIVFCFLTLHPRLFARVWISS